MRAAPYQLSHYRPRAMNRSRVVAILLTLFINAIMVLMLIKMGVLAPFVQKPEQKLTTFDVLPNKEASSVKKVVKDKRAGGSSAPSPEPKTQPPAVPPPSTTPFPPEIIQLSRSEFASANIASLPQRPGAGAQGATSGKDSGSDYGPGEGPNGERLYRAEWYREPTNAELQLYIPPGGIQEGWAEIACRTVPDYRVEDCRELGESPAGSKMARMLRQAAWQFRVRPPRVGGKALVGAWVRIHYDFSQRGEK
jgi:protein TonB